ncbi:MAG TPA: hypothetical protein VJH03_15645 [Blastocatellia bacterium]|nr:hypothetical protein [Blastocatellia bacterium]
MRRVLFGLAACLYFSITAAAILNAQASYQPGQKIEYKAQRYPEKWEVGTVVGMTPDGRQVIIRQKPNQYYPEGFQTAFSLEDVRPLRNQAATGQPVKRDTPEKPVPSQQDDTKHEPRGASVGNGAGLMSQQDVLSFLRDRLGKGDPFMNPRREQVLQELRKEILRRGVSFRYQSIGEFANEIGKFGPPTGVTAALFANYGPPAKRDSLFGKWYIAKVGATTTYSRGGSVYERREYGGNAGSLTIDESGTYTWNSPSGVLKGQWREATAEEMAKSDKGGEGVVLLNAKSRLDWIVFRRNDEGPQGDGIKITDLDTRNMRELGTRR